MDLPIRLGEEAGAVIAAEIGVADQNWHLARVDFAGGSLWTRDHDLPIGRKVRIRVLTRDVSLAQTHPGSSSSRMSYTVESTPLPMTTIQAWPWCAYRLAIRYW